MNSDRASQLVQIYPQEWRERYGEEFAAVLEAQPGSVVVMLDVLRGALDAHLHASWLVGRGIPMERRLRLYEVAFFCAFMLFFVGFLPFGRIADPTPTFDAAARAHPMLAAVYHVVIGITAVATLLVALGGIPVLLASVLGAWRARDWRALRPFVGAVVLLVLYGAYSLGVLLFETTRPGYNTPGGGAIRPIDAMLFLDWLAFTLIGAALGPALVGLVVARAHPPLRVLRFALWCAGGALVLMAATLVGTVGITVLIQMQAPSLNISQDTALGIQIVMIACMLVGVAVGLVAFVRALRLRPDPVVQQARAA